MRALDVASVPIVSHGTAAEKAFMENIFLKDVTHTPGKSEMHRSHSVMLSRGLGMDVYKLSLLSHARLRSFITSVAQEFADPTCSSTT